MVATSAENVSPTWASVHTGAGDVLLQLRSIGPVEVVITGGTAPTDTPDAQGIIMTKNQFPVLSANGLGAGDSVYLRSLSGSTEIVSALIGG